VLPWDSKGFYIVMTQGHSVDLPILESLLQRGLPAYIGVIGSPVKGMKIKKALLERGIPSDYLEFLRCPIGLDLGTNDPAEIAVSVTAELLQCRDEQKSESRPL